MGKTGDASDKQSSTLIDSALIISLRPHTQLELQKLLGEADVNSVVVADTDEARAAIAKTAFPVALIDVDSLPLTQVLSLLTDLRRLAPRSELIAFLMSRTLTPPCSWCGAERWTSSVGPRMICACSDLGWRRRFERPSSAEIAARCSVTTAPLPKTCCTD